MEMAACSATVGRLESVARRGELADAETSGTGDVPGM